MHTGAYFLIFIRKICTAVETKLHYLQFLIIYMQLLSSNVVDAFDGTNHVNMWLFESAPKYDMEIIIHILKVWTRTTNKFAND